MGISSSQPHVVVSRILGEVKPGRSFSGTRIFVLGCYDEMQVTWAWKPENFWLGYNAREHRCFFEQDDFPIKGTIEIGCAVDV